MLQSMSGMYRRYLPANAESDSFARLIDSLDDAAWDRLVDNIPAGIADGEPKDFDRFRDVSADDLREAAG